VDGLTITEVDLTVSLYSVDGLTITEVDLTASLCSTPDKVD
jgi:hypothetical protein